MISKEEWYILMGDIEAMKEKYEDRLSTMAPDDLDRGWIEGRVDLYGRLMRGIITGEIG